MTDSAEASLLGLQKLDRLIDEATARMAAYEPQLEQIAEPVERLEAEVTGLKARLQELQLDERRLELSAQERRERLAKLQERLNGVRNLREEAAVHAELDLVRRSLEADEQEALSLLDLIRRNEERLGESSAQLEVAQAELEPKREEIVRLQKEIRAELDAYDAERAAYVEGVPLEERRLYERIKAGGRPAVVAAMTGDGACGNCFAMVPLQLQNEVRAGRRLTRCEFCGVIVAPPLSEEEEQAEREAKAALAAEAAALEEAQAEAEAAEAEAEAEEAAAGAGVPALEPVKDPIEGVEGVLPTLPRVDKGPALPSVPTIPSLEPVSDEAPASDEGPSTE